MASTPKPRISQVDNHKDGMATTHAWIPAKFPC